MNFIASLICTTIDSLWVESQRFANSKALKNIIGLSVTLFAVGVVVAALFGFISNLGGY